MITAQHAEQILATATTKVPDELALYVLGDFACANKFTVMRTHAPAVDEFGRQVLLTGQLLQLGDKHVKLNQKRHRLPPTMYKSWP